MVQSILDALFGCSHQRTTFPLTAGRKNALRELMSCVWSAVRSSHITGPTCGSASGYPQACAPR